MTYEERTYEPPLNETPEVVFMRRWLLAAVENVLANLEEYCDRPDLKAGYEALLARRFPQRSPLRLSQQALATKYGLTRDDVRTAEEKVEKRFRRLLAAEIRAQVDSEEELDREIREIMALWQG